jgi:cytochrome c2
MDREMNAGLRISWHILTIVLLVAGPSLASSGPLWALDREDLLPLLLVAGGYSASVIVGAARTRLWPAKNLVIDVVIALAIFCLVFFFILMARMTYVRSVLLVACFAAACAILALPLVRRFTAVAVAGLGVVVVAVFAAHVTREVSPPVRMPMTTTRIVPTALYALRARHFLRIIEPPIVPGGGIARFGEDYLAATGDGRLFLVGWNAQENLQLKDLQIRVPLNADAFAAAAAPHDLALDYFRVNDVMVHEAAESVQIFASHQFFAPERQCFFLRVSTFEADRETIENRPADIEWRTVFDTSPCLPIVKEGRGELFNGHVSGGQMAMLDEDSLLLTVGDFQFDGWYAPQILAQDEATMYGKTLVVSVSSGAARAFTRGNRNAQGLYIDPSGGIWATEQGPRGGDELNLLIENENYGWPLVTYGTSYETLEWPLNRAQGRHRGFERPVFSWVPSIGVSALIGIERDRFALWRGDLIAASLRGGSIYRIGLAEGAVRFVEPIDMGHPIRDLVEGQDGRIVLWTNDAEIVLLEPASDSAGFAMKCSGCHAVGNGTMHGIGPDLRGVYGRKMASASGFAYSGAFRELDGVWREDNLDEFLKDPRAFVPGTLMAIEGIEDPSEREAIIELLRSM